MPIANLEGALVYGPVILHGAVLLDKAPEYVDTYPVNPRPAQLLDKLLERLRTLLFPVMKFFACLLGSYPEQHEISALSGANSAQGTCSKRKKTKKVYFGHLSLYLHGL